MNGPEALTDDRSFKGECPTCGQCHLTAALAQCQRDLAACATERDAALARVDAAEDSVEVHVVDANQSCARARVLDEQLESAWNIVDAQKTRAFLAEQGKLAAESALAEARALLERNRKLLALVTMHLQTPWPLQREVGLALQAAIKGVVITAEDVSLLSRTPAPAGKAEPVCEYDSDGRTPVFRDAEHPDTIALRECRAELEQARAAERAYDDLVGDMDPPDILAHWLADRAALDSARAERDTANHLLKIEQELCEEANKRLTASRARIAELEAGQAETYRVAIDVRNAWHAKEKKRADGLHEACVRHEARITELERAAEIEAFALGGARQARDAAWDKIAELKRELAAARLQSKERGDELAGATKAEKTLRAAIDAAVLELEQHLLPLCSEEGDIEHAGKSALSLLRAAQKAGT